MCVALSYGVCDMCGTLLQCVWAHTQSPFAHVY